MINPEIISFIKQQASAGVSQEQITNSLKQNGWSDQDIGEAFRVISGQNVPVAPTSIPTPVPAAIFVVWIIILLLRNQRNINKK